MLIQTPRMYISEFLPAGWESSIYFMLATMRGGGNIIHDDCSPMKYVPATALTRNSNRTITVNTAVVAHSYTYPAIAATTDILDIWVAKPITKNIAQAITGQTSTQGFSNKLNSAAGPTPCSGFADSVTGNETSTVTIVNDWAAGELIMSVAALDRSDATTGLHDYKYSLDNSHAIYDEGDAHTQGATLTPASNARHLNLGSLYLHASFAFLSNGLPSTWKADCLAMAQAVVALKDG